VHTGACTLLLATILFAVHPALGEQISGRVVGVSDGDTITVLVAAKVQHKGAAGRDRRSGEGASVRRALETEPRRAGIWQGCPRRLLQARPYGRVVCRVW